METKLQRKLKQLPSRPGVYLLKDDRGSVIYVGKAKSLRSRVRGHFSADGADSPKNREMVRRIRDVDTIVTADEAEALLLEANLIKAHRPRFNVQLRDDKRYPYIKVTVEEPFPRVFVTRRIEDDGARYFGPYTEVGPLRQALELIKRLYTVRSCNYRLPAEQPARPCLDYHIGRCRAPCVGLQDEADYRAMIDEILDVLAGRTETVRPRIETRMLDAADAMDFERAARLRDALSGLATIERRQRALDLRGGDQDVLGMARDGDRACAVLLRIRSGRLLGRSAHFFENLTEEADSTVATAAASRFFLAGGRQGRFDLPRELVLPVDFDDRPTLERVLTDWAGRRVATYVPSRGSRYRLVQLANENARHLMEERALLDESVLTRADDSLYDLRDALGLKVVPRSIVCFDISHTQGSAVVGSAVFFENGEPKKSEYRRFRVTGDWGNDDYRSMAEVVERYFRRRLEEDRPLPELAVVDGGRGQLRTTAEAAAAAGAADIAFIGLAKREEAIYLPERAQPIRLPRTSVALRLLQRIRNEAHRFAHDYNRRLRTRRALASELDRVPGIGPQRRRALLRRFGSTRALLAASEKEVAAVPGISDRLARTILACLMP